MWQSQSGRADPVSPPKWAGSSLQGYLAHQRTPSPETQQKAYAYRGTSSTRKNVPSEIGPNLTPVFFLCKKIGRAGFSFRFIHVRKRWTERFLRFIWKDENANQPDSVCVKICFGLVSLTPPENAASAFLGPKQCQRCVTKNGFPSGATVKFPPEPSQLTPFKNIQNLQPELTLCLERQRPSCAFRPPLPASWFYSCSGC